MVVIAKSTIDEFIKKHPTAAEPLTNWYKETKLANWSNYNEMKQTFNSVDGVGNDRYVFNVKGNDYRLIALTLFSVRTVFILWIGTHAAYDKLNKTTGAKNVQFKG